MIAVILVSALIFLLCAWSWKVYFQRGHTYPPFFPGILPIIGHIHILAGDGLSLWRFVKNVSADAIKQGGVVSVFLGFKLYYFISDPEDAVTAGNACLEKNFAFDFAKPWLGNGLLTAPGVIWRHHRKLLTPAFSLPVIYSFLNIFNSQSRKFVDILKHEVGKPINHSVYFKNFALETFFLTAFGIKAGFANEDFIKKYMHATDSIMAIITSRFQNFWLQSDFIFKISGLKRKHDKLVDILNAMSVKVIQAKREAKHNNSSVCLSKTEGMRGKPLLDLLLELSDENALTDKEIREEVDTTIVTGYDTISTLLSYIMMFLGTHSRVQEKVYEEVIRVFPTPRDVTKEDFQDMIYTEAVIKESLRLITIVPALLRYVEKDVKLKNYTMRAGSDCVILLYGAHRDPIWGTDVEQFRPERWLDSNMSLKTVPFAGFGVGQRYCIGRQFAMISMKTTLIHLLRHYKVTADISKLQLRMDFVLNPVSGHEICLEERT